MGRQVEIGSYTEIRPLTMIRCDGEVKVGAYTVVSSFTLVYGTASFIVGDHCYIGPQCLINVDEDVRIGKGSALGPRCMIFTHGSFLPYTEGYWTRLGAVTIGDHVWIAAGVFIHPGVQVGNNVFVNSRSVLSQHVAAGEVVEGYPAQRVTEIEKVKRRMTPQRVDAAAAQMLERFAEIVLRRRFGVALEKNGTNLLDFQYRGREYILASVPSGGAICDFPHKTGSARWIFLVNQPNWTPPATVKQALIFDLTSMRTRVSRDTMHRELWQFMRMYFGVTFEYH